MINRYTERYRKLFPGRRGLTIKNAVDSMHIGILFGEPSGLILLQNQQMMRLMTALTAKAHINGNDFYSDLASGILQKDCRKMELEGNLVCILPDNTAWMFVRSDLMIMGKKYIQITASDITRRAQLLEDLRQKDEFLRIRSLQLQETIANLQEASYERAMQKAKTHTHDILGQRLSIVLNSIRSKQGVDFDLLGFISHGLVEELTYDGPLPTPQEEFDSLCQVCGAVGINIVLDGSLPDDIAQGCLCVEIIREAITNAVRHGYASTVTLDMETQGTDFHLQISNNGLPPSHEVKEGEGLRGMRRKLESLGGVLSVRQQPEFTLTVTLPVGSS